MKLKSTLIHIGAIAVMLIVSCVYFSPALSGDVVVQGDMQKADAMAHAQKSVADSTGTIPNWNPSMFSGMPGYQTAVEPQKSVFTVLKSILIMRPIGLERNIGILWLYLIGFYVAMIALGCSPWISLFGALAFGLGSYNIIIVEAGHITKAWAMSMIAPVFAGMVLSLRAAKGGDTNKINWRRLVWGSILFTIALGLQITFNHIQITYYTALGGVVVGLTYFIYSLKEKWFGRFAAVVGILLAGCMLAVGGNYRHLTVNREYADVTMRGGSEITVTPHDIGIENAAGQETTQSGGLDIDYAFSWSYGVGETYTVLVPGAMGGGSGERVADDSDWARRTGQRQAPLYWGDQPFTSGPVYFGAIVLFLFALGCIVVKGPEKWWLVIVSIIAIFMSWGRHFMPLNGFLFNHLPLYNMFRTPSMSLVLANVCMAVMAALTMKSIVDAFKKTADGRNGAVASYDITKRLNRALYWAVGIVGGIIVVGMLVAKSRLDFVGVGDEQYKSMLGDQWPAFQSMLVDARRSLFMHDSLRSLAFVVLAFSALWLYVNNRIKKSGIILLFVTILTVVDLWGVDRRYLNDDNFTAPERLKLHRTPSEQNLDIVAALNGDSDYRVYDLTVNTFNDSRPSAFHNQIGGYSAAKLRRYQDLIDFYLGSQKLYDYVRSCQIGMIGNHNGTALLSVQEPYPVLDMLNARYLMLDLGQGQPSPVRRTSALGNCWFVDDVACVEDANNEILSLNNIDPAHTAIVNSSEFDIDASSLARPADSSESIVLVHSYPQTPDRLTYKSHTNGSRLAVFSEIYYAPDWRAYIDDKPVDHLRVDYVLRALVVPAGDHTITFVNEAPTLHRLDNITLIVSLFMLAVMATAIVLVYRKKK